MFKIGLVILLSIVSAARAVVVLTDGMVYNVEYRGPTDGLWTGDTSLTVEFPKKPHTSTDRVTIKAQLNFNGIGGASMTDDEKVRLASAHLVGIKEHIDKGWSFRIYNLQDFLGPDMKRMSSIIMKEGKKQPIKFKDARVVYVNTPSPGYTHLFCDWEDVELS